MILLLSDNILRGFRGGFSGAAFVSCLRLVALEVSQVANADPGAAPVQMSPRKYVQSST